MQLTPTEFRHWKQKSITLIGMSGVGKTYLSHQLRQAGWFHYSGDYRIGTRYLDEDILDLIKAQAMQVPFLCDLLRKDWISIRNNIKITDLGPVLTYIGKIGNPEQGGTELAEFKRRQANYRAAEIAAMRDVPDFIQKARNIYGYPNFINDAGGSLCELDDSEMLQQLTQHTLLLYIRVTDQAEQDMLIWRAQQAPKPLYYHPDFLNDYLHRYLQQNQLAYAAEIAPDDFARWVFPHLFRARVPRYNAIAQQGYTVTAAEVAAVRDETDFLQLIETAIARQETTYADHSA
ncbi:MAG: ATPase [Pseudomonadota bacterium]